jgi:hypothetical protein
MLDSGILFAQTSQRGFAPHLVASDENDASTHPRQLFSGNLANAGGRSGDDDYFAFHRNGTIS